MSAIFLNGLGAVSPAGWGVDALVKAISTNEPLPVSELARPGWPRGFKVRQVPAPQTRLHIFSNPRLRRSSSISKYAVAAALEALGPRLENKSLAPHRLGIIFCMMSGCVNYTRRFYDEVLKDPSTASPLLFPETVFNAPASHLAAILGTNGINYTLVGDPGTFLQGLALASDLLASEQLDGCLVVGAEEIDWITVDAFQLFSRKVILSEGAGAVLLTREGGSSNSVQLASVTNSFLFLRGQTRACACDKMRSRLSASASDSLLCLGTQGVKRFDADEEKAWRDWNGARLEPKRILGEGLMAAPAWQCVAAALSLNEKSSSEALVSVVGCNQQAIGAHFVLKK